MDIQIFHNVIERIGNHLSAWRAAGQHWWLDVADVMGSPAHIGLLLLAIVAGLVSRRMSLLLAAGLWATLGVYLLNMAPAETQPFVVTMVVASQFAVLAGAFVERRMQLKLARATAVIEEEKHDVQVLLDREIAWRRAADPA